jgi:hypothetical protein
MKMHDRAPALPRPGGLTTAMPAHGLDKIKFATDAPTWGRALALYENGKITNFKSDKVGYSATVHGGHQYHVFVSAHRYDEGSCNCYLGQNDTLCKHMVAVALYAMKGGDPLNDKEKQLLSAPVCSGKLGELSNKDVKAVTAAMSGAMRYIKPYNGPSRIWFAYQGSLRQGCNRLSVIISELPVSEQTTELLIKLLLRLDDKLSRGGVDDSDGTVGGFIEETVHALEQYAKLDPACTKAFRLLADRETCFGWEEPLLKLTRNNPKTAQ